MTLTICEKPQRTQGFSPQDLHLQRSTFDARRPSPSIWFKITNTAVPICHKVGEHTMGQLSSRTPLSSRTALAIYVKLAHQLVVATDCREAASTSWTLNYTMIQSNAVLPSTLQKICTKITNSAATFGMDDCISCWRMSLPLSKEEMIT